MPEQIVLINPPRPFPRPPRPTTDDKPVRLAAAKMLLPKVMDWLPYKERAGFEEEILGQLADALRCCSTGDGYALARYLDSKGWCPDAALVEILNDSCIWEAHTEAVKVWVKETGILPDLAEGDSCEFSE
jgi:hypothetical protein